jgi:hypothetical protein
MTTRRPSKRQRTRSTRRQRSGKGPSEQEYLAVELGHLADREGEPAGLNSPASRRDGEIQAFAIELWRQAHAGRTVSTQLREMEREGLATDEVWAAGITEFLPTSSTADELRLYKKKLLFRANLLEAFLMETVAGLKRLDRLQPTNPAKKTG